MSPTLWLVASSVGMVGLVILTIVYRRAAARRELELAEAAIDAEYTADPPAPARESRARVRSPT